MSVFNEADTRFFSRVVYLVLGLAAYGVLRTLYDLYQIIQAALA